MDKQTNTSDAVASPEATPPAPTASRWDAAAPDTQLYFRQHDRQKNRWEARTEIPRHLCPREDLRLQFGGALFHLKIYRLKINRKHIKSIRKNPPRYMFLPGSKKRTCVTSSGMMIKKTSALLSAFRRWRRLCCYLEDSLDIRSRFSQRLQARIVHTAINRRRGTKQPSIWDSCVRGAAGTQEDSKKLCLDASSARAATENKNLFLHPASTRLCEAQR